MFIVKGALGMNVYCVRYYSNVHSEGALGVNVLCVRCFRNECSLC